MHHDDATPNGPVQAGTPSRARAIVMREVFKHRATAETLSPAAILARTQFALRRPSKRSQLLQIRN